MRMAIVCLLWLMILLPSCTKPGDYQVTIELAGDAGIEFTGWYITAYTGPDTTAANGTTPASWVVTVRRDAGDAISAWFLQDSLPAGTMVGRLIVEGDTVEADTTGPAKPAFHLFWDPEP